MAEKQKKKINRSDITIDGKIISFILSKNIKIYPFYFEKDTIANKKKYLKDNWYVQVDKDGKLTTFTKSIGTGKKIKMVDFALPIKKTYEYYYNKLNK